MGNRFCSYYTYVIDVRIRASPGFPDFGARLETLLAAGASVNFYMFHGGTSFGFMNGGNVFDPAPHYAPDVTSYGTRIPHGHFR